MPRVVCATGYRDKGRYTVHRLDDHRLARRPLAQQHLAGERRVMAMQTCL